METELFRGRLRDLARRAGQNNYLTHTEFLSASELADFYEILRKLSASLSADLRHGTLDGVPFVIYGGHAEAERNVICFLPDWQSPEDFSAAAENGDVLKMLRVLPANRRFAEELSHRDFLGALMNLGIERDRIGDILVSEEETCIFVLSELSELVARELSRVKHTSVQCTVCAPVDCRIRPRYEALSGSVASNRLDAVMSMAYHLSRGTAQELIERELAAINGRTCSNAGKLLQPGDRISVRGHGKFIYDGEEKRTKKGRIYVKIRKLS